MGILTRGDIVRAFVRAGEDTRRRSRGAGRMLAEHLDDLVTPSSIRYAPGHAVVLVDEGIATGLTMRAAVASARRHGARSSPPARSGILSPMV
jgi:predicted phosphoribosyltransferase